MQVARASQPTFASATGQLGGQGIEGLAPVRAEAVKPLVDGPKGGRVDGVEPACAFGTDRREPVVPQHPKVLRHGRLRDAELLLNDCGDRTGSPLPVGELLQDSAPNRITENIEGVHEPTMTASAYISQDCYTSAATLRDRRAVTNDPEHPDMHQQQPRLVSITTRLASPEFGLDVEIRLRELDGRWLAVAEFDGDPEVGIGASPRAALAASLATLGKRAAAALMSDPALFGASAQLRQPA